MLIFVMLLGIAAAPSLRAMDLMEAYTQAKSYDPAFAAAVYEHEAVRTLSKQGLSTLLPQVQANASGNNYNFGDAPSTYSNYTAWSMGVSLRQPLLNVPKFYEYRQYTLREAIGETKYALAEQDLLYRVAEAYFNVLAAGNMLDVVESEKKAVIEQREQARRMFAGGVSTLTDVHEAEARYDTIVAKEVDVRNTLDLKVEALKKIIGVEPNALSLLREDATLSIPEPRTLSGWIDIARQRHPGLLSYIHQIDYQEAEYNKNLGQNWPTVDLTTGYTMTNTNNLVRTQDTAYSSIGFQVSLPVFNGGYTVAKMRESKANLAQTKKEYDRALSDISQKISDAFLGIRSSVAKIDALVTALKSAETSLHSNQMGLRAGVRTTADVLNAQKDCYDIRARLLQARYDGLMNIFRLKMSAGTLSAEDLPTFNAWLQTTAAK